MIQAATRGPTKEDTQIDELMKDLDEVTVVVARNRIKLIEIGKKIDNLEEASPDDLIDLLKTFSELDVELATILVNFMEIFKEYVRIHG